MSADATKMPVIRAEWVPLINLLSLHVAELDHPLYIHEVASWGQAKKIARALRVELYGERTEECVLDALKIQVPPDLTIESATWIRSRRTVFFETNIRDSRDRRRYMTLAAVPTEDAAFHALQVLNIPLPLTVDNSLSILEVVAQLYALGRSEREIAAETGFDPDMVRRNVDAFKRYQEHRFEEQKARSDKPPVEG